MKREVVEGNPALSGHSTHLELITVKDIEE